MLSCSSRRLTSSLQTSLVLAVVLGISLWSCTSSKKLASYGSVPAFQLQDQDGQSLSLNDLDNKIWVANFIFTKCAGTCPMLTRRMQDVARWMETHGTEQMKIVSFSVDPDRDTPQNLKAYAKSFGIDTKRWSFVTGPKGELRKTIVGGFKIGMEKVDIPDSELTLFDIVHGERFALVDGKGTVRGYYAADLAGINELISALMTLKDNS